MHRDPRTRRGSALMMVMAIVVVLLVQHLKEGRPAMWQTVAVAAIVGGAIGNLVDRIRSARGVVDFLDVGIGALRWPTFNVADIAVSCGAIALAISLWREDARRPEQESASAA